MRMTIKNPGSSDSYRAPLNRTGRIEVKWQQETPVFYGEMVNLLGRYEDLGTPEELEKLKHKNGPK